MAMAELLIFTDFTPEEKAEYGLVPKPSYDMTFCYRVDVGNDCECSIIKGSRSYGGWKDLWELAFIDEKGRISETPFYDEEVVGYLTNEGVFELLKKIKEWVNREPK